MRFAALLFVLLGAIAAQARPTGDTTVQVMVNGAASGGPATPWDTNKVATMLMSLANFAFVVWVWTSNQKEKRREALAKAQAFWLQDVIVKPHVDTLSKYFKTTDELVTSLKTSVGGLNPDFSVNQFFDEFAKQHLKIKYDLLHPLIAVSGDSSKPISKLIDDFENEMTAYATALLEPRAQPIRPDVNTYRVKLIAALHQMHVKAICAPVERPAEVDQPRPPWKVV